MRKLKKTPSLKKQPAIPRFVKAAAKDDIEQFRADLYRASLRRMEIKRQLDAL